MKRKIRLLMLICVYALILTGFLASGFSGSRVATVISETAPLKGRKTIIIDAGHGGVDGGATSCTGVLESEINLEIALRLRDLCHLLGMKTVMIRESDRSVYTQGNTIAEKKVSDLKERVRIVNGTDNAVLVSIHQNYFSDSRYKGAQVFYESIGDSQMLAKSLQSCLVQNLNPGSTRQEKKAEGIYLMEHIQCTGVLIECGFISNPTEEAQLRNESYQKKLCSVIACVCSRYLYKPLT